MWEGQEPAQALPGFVALDSGPSRPAFAERGHMWEGPGLVPVTCARLGVGDVSIHRSSPRSGGLWACQLHAVWPCVHPGMGAPLGQDLGLPLSAWSRRLGQGLRRAGAADELTQDYCCCRHLHVCVKKALMLIWPTGWGGYGVTCPFDPDLEDYLWQVFLPGWRKGL